MQQRYGKGTVRSTFAKLKKTSMPTSATTVSFLKEKCLFDLRQRTADDIRVACVSHVERNFENRIKSHAKHLVSNAQAVVDQMPLAKDRQSLTNELVQLGAR